MTLQISAPSGGMSLTYDIVPFTVNAGLDRSENERGVRQAEQFRDGPVGACGGGR